MSSPLDPTVDDCNRPFFDAAARGDLVVQRCAACGLHRHPPHERCPKCHAGETTWTTVAGAGSVWSFVVAHPPLPAPLAELAPVTVLLVALDDPEGVRMVGTLLHAGGRRPEIGDRVSVVFESVGGGPVLPHWQLVG